MCAESWGVRVRYGELHPLLISSSSYALASAVEPKPLYASRRQSQVRSRPRMERGKRIKGVDAVGQKVEPFGRDNEIGRAVPQTLGAFRGGTSPWDSCVIAPLRREQVFSPRRRI